MDNKTNNNIDELTLMRSQMEELKAKLNREVKINEDNVRKLQKRSMDFAKKYLVFAWAVLPVVALMFIGIKFMFGVSWATTVVVILMCAIDVYFDTRFNRMKNADIESMSLVDMSEKLSWMKRMRRKQLNIGLPFAIAWAIWFIVELYIAVENGWGIFPADHLMATVMVASVVTGSVFGGIIGYMIYRRMQHDADSVLEQIEALKAGN